MVNLNESIEGTVFFVDMRNFTFLCSKMADNPAEDKIITGSTTQYEARFKFMIAQMEHFYSQWLKILQKYIEKENITQVIFQSTGDGVMIALEGKLHYLAAFEASIEIAKYMRVRLDKTINPKLSNLGILRWNDKLDFGIGICSGIFKYVEVPQIVGSLKLRKNKDIMDKKIKNYITILGTAPNYASRVEQATKDHANSYILIAESTIDLLREHYAISASDTRKIEDTLGVKYLWKHRLKGIRELGLYIYYIDRKS